MFFSKSSQSAQSNKQVAILTKTIEQLEARIKQMQDDAESAKQKDIDTSNFAIDFNKMRVCALERNMHSGMVCTIIGHLIAEPVGDTGNFKEHLKEYYFYCSQEQHEKLIKEFEAHKKNTK